MCDTLSQNRINLIKKHDSSTLLSRDVPDTGLKDSLEDTDLQIESERLKTFKNLHNLNPEDLARIGLYQVDNKAKCAFCQIEIAFSSFGENPLDDHLRLSPSCPFARGKKGQRTLTNFLRAPLPPDQDVCGNVDTFTDSLSFLRKVAHPFKDVHSRLKSFENWPKSSKLKPESLAAAGFYYRGFGDKTICFRCSGPLNNWEDDDEPWEQHALWFPKCKFVLEEKGEDFIEGVQKKFKNNLLHGLSVDTKENNEDGQTTVVDDKKCLLCCNNQRDVVFVPCGHDWACSQCTRLLEDKKCPICRKLIVQIRTL